MTWSIVGIIIGIFFLGFCAGNIFQIWVRPKPNKQSRHSKYR